MKLKATYNFLVLLFIYAFSCVCVRGIEAVYDTNLNMLVVFNNMWTATIETVFLSIVVIACIWANRSKADNMTASGLVTATLIFNTIWFVGLFLVVMGNLSGTSEFLTGRSESSPFLCGIAVNVVAVFLYCASFFSVEKYGTGILYKTIVSGIAITFDIVSMIFSTSYMPINVMHAIYKDKERHDLLVNIEHEIKSNPDFKPDLSTVSTENCRFSEDKEIIERAIKEGNITISVIDDVHIKLGWKRHIEPAELDKLPAKKKILETFSRWYSWGCFYKQTEKIIEMSEKVNQQKLHKSADKETSEKK